MSEKRWPESNPGNPRCNHIYMIVRQPNGHPLLVCSKCPREVR